MVEGERGFLEIHTVAYVNPQIVYRWRIPGNDPDPIHTLFYKTYEDYSFKIGTS